MYEAQGISYQLEELKPNLEQNQILLLNAFYRLSQERRTQENVPLLIKDKDINYYQSIYGSCGYAPDIFVYAIRSIDAQYIENRCDEIKRKSKKG